MRTSSLFSLLALLAIVAPSIAASEPKPERPLCSTSLPIDGSAGQTFAPNPNDQNNVAVAVEGNIVAAGYGGLVMIYWFDANSNTLSLVQNITTDDTISGASFGQALNLNNGILVVGQPGWVDLASPNSNVHGRVFTYKTLSDDTGFVDFFQLGDAIVCTDTQDGLNGNSGYGSFVFQRNMTLVISSPQCCQGNRIGAAYTYHYNETANTWDSARPGPFGELPLQTPASLPVGSQFGASVAFDKGMLLGAAPYLNDYSNSSVLDTGGILYFSQFDIATGALPACGSPTCLAKLSTWGQYSPTEDARCGTQMSELNSDISNRIAIGCPGQNTEGQVLIGSVFAPSFQFSNRIAPPSPTANEGFGAAVAAQYDTVVVGTEAGLKVYIFERVPVPRAADKYVNTQNLTEAARTQFGQSIDLDESLLVIGSLSGLDVYNCGKPVKGAAIALIPFFGLLLLSAIMLL